MNNIINSKNFNQKFSKILNTKKGENIIWGRYDIESVGIEEKNNFIIKLISGQIIGVTYKILFWDNDEIIQNFINTNYKGNYSILTNYANGEEPGILYIDDIDLNNFFFDKLLTNHFNYELAKDPSLNIRIQICINYINHIKLLDIYDDRGFDIYFTDQLKP